MTYPELESIVKQAKCKRKKKTKLPTRQQLKRRKKKAESQESNMSIQQDSGFVEKFAEAVVRARDARMEKEANKAAILSSLTARLGAAKKSIGRGLGTAKKYLGDVSGASTLKAQVPEWLAKGHHEHVQSLRAAYPKGRARLFSPLLSKSNAKLKAATQGVENARTARTAARTATKDFAREKALPVGVGLGVGSLLAPRRRPTA